MKKFAFYVVALAHFSFSGPANSLTIFGYSITNEAKDSKGQPTPVAITNPFGEFLVLPDDVFDPDQLTDIPGSVVGFFQNTKGETLLVPFNQPALKGTATAPVVKPGDFTYESYLVDTKAAASLGVPAAALSVSGDYKVEYRFFRGATSRIQLAQIDSAKFSAIAAAIRARAGVQSDFTLKDIQIVTAAAILESSYSVMQGVEAKADVGGAGWKIGNTFYSSKQMTKNKTKIGIATRAFADISAAVPSDAASSVTKPVAELTGGTATKLKSEHALKAIFPSALKLDR